MIGLDIEGWRARILEAVPNCRSRIEWAEKKLNRCESDLERGFVMLLGILMADVDNVSFAGEFAPDASGVGRLYTLDFEQQVRIGEYRCDFILTVRSAATDRAMRVAIECDGHSFHDRTPEQASADRRRDRKLIAMGIPTLRYTYSDLTKNPAESMRDLHTTIQSIARHFCVREAQP